MEFLNNIKIFSTPLWVKFAIIIILITTSALNIIIFWDGFNTPKLSGWIEGGAELLSVILPIFIASLLIAFSNTGVKSLIKRTDHILRKSLPEKLAKTPDYYNGFNTIDAKKLYNDVIVKTNHIKGHCFSDYEITFKNREKTKAYKIIIRVELNVLKVNFNIFINTQNIEKALQISNDNKDIDNMILDSFNHTISGAQGLQKIGTNEIRYSFNPKLIKRSIDNTPFLCLVGSSIAPDDLLWDPSVTLYFIQDIMIMTRSFFQENPCLFEDTKES